MLLSDGRAGCSVGRFRLALYMEQFNMEAENFIVRTLIVFFAQPRQPSS